MARLRLARGTAALTHSSAWRRGRWPSADARRSPPLEAALPLPPKDSKLFPRCSATATDARCHGQPTGLHKRQIQRVQLAPSVRPAKERKRYRSRS